MCAKKTDHYFLSGGGEMGERIRDKDWSKTVLGDPEYWPQSLRTTLSILLHSKFPMFLFWGDQFICFYNDAYRPSLGKEGKHPDILGGRGEDHWKEIWPVIKPLLDQVMAGGEATWSEDQLLPIYRNGEMESVYWTFSYSRVMDERGKAAGVFVTCSETTEKVVTRVKLEESKEQLHFAVESAELGTWDYNPVTNRFSSNDRLKGWFGLSSEKDIDLAYAINVIAEKDRGRISAAIKQSLDYHTGGSYEEEFSIIEPVTNTERIVQVKGKAWFNEEKIAYRLNGVMEDITEQALARRKIKESEQRFQAAVSAMSGILWTNNAKGEMEGEQRSWAELTGQRYADYQGYGWVNAVHPEDAQSTVEAWNDAVKERKTFIFEHRIKTKNGAWGDFSIRAIPLLNKDGSIREWVGVHSDITEQKKAEYAIRKSEKRFRDTVKQAPIGITILRGPKFIVEMANDAYLQVVDRKKDEFVGRPLFDSLPEVESSVQPLLSGVLNTGIPFHGIDYPIPVNRFGKQELSYFDFLYHPLKEEDGSISGIIVTVTDVSSSVKARHSLAENEKQFRSLVMQSPIAMTIFRGEEYIIEMANKVMIEKLWRKEEAEVMGKKMLEVFPELKEQKYPDLLYQVYHSGLIHSEKESLAFVQGDDGMKKFYLDYDYRPLMEADGKIYGIIATVNDVTEKVEARKKIEEREQKFRLLADSMPQFIWTGDADGQLNYFNQSVYQYSGLTAENMLKNGWLQIVHPDEQEENIKQWQIAIKTGTDFLFEHRFRRYDGEYRWQLSRAIPQKDANGNIQMWVGTSTDIQDQKIFTTELEKEVHQRTLELKQKNDDLEKMNKELEAFAYISSHDLQEPLRKIQTFSSRILEKEYQNLSESGKDNFERMENASKRMQTLINDLLTYSRTKTNEKKFEKTDLNKIVDAVKEDLKEELLQKKATVETDNLCELYIIPFQFRQLLYNLISNSLKFSNKQDTPHIQIKSEIINGADPDIEKLAKELNYCHISISDNGIGFEPQYSERIFEVFQRLHGIGEYKGTGIGLAIVKTIVENHQGIITAKGEVNKGATFDMYIPIDEKQ